MKKYILIISLLATGLSCNNRLESRYYKSSNDGYNQFELYLKADKEIEMIIQTSRAIVSDTPGDTWAEIKDTITGNWNLKNGKIECVFDKTKINIDKIFENSDFKVFKNNKLLYFSVGLDTAYIYGLPCILEKKTPYSL